MVDWIIFHLETIMSNLPIAFAVLFLLALVNLYLPPTPLETVTLFAGYLSGIGRGSLWIIISATTAGMFCGSAILFSLVKTKGIEYLEWTPFKKWLSGPSYRKGMAWFKKIGIYGVYVGKLIPGMSLASVIGCGVFRWNNKSALLAFLGSNFIFYSALAFTGKLLGTYWGRALPWLTKVSVITVILVLGAAFLPTVFRFFSKKRKKNPV